MAARVKRELAAHYSGDEVVSRCGQLPCAVLSERKSLPISHPQWSPSPTTGIWSHLARAGKPLRLDILPQALAHLVGQHDFRAFSAQRGELPSDTRRTIQKVSLAHRGELLTLTFSGRWISFFTRWSGC